MSTLEASLLNYLANSLWQVPLVFAVAWMAARVLRAMGAAVEHRVWVGALFAEALLPACSASPIEWLRAFALSLRPSDVAGQAHVSVVMGAGVSLGALRLPAHLLSTIAIAYATLCGYFLLRLFWRSWKLSTLRREATAISLTGEAAQCWARCSKRFGVQEAGLAASANLFGPVALGLRRKLVLLPAHMVTGLPTEDLQTVLAHEFAHLHRGDFTRNLVYEVLTLPASYHPLLWLTREHVIETREILCDAMAAEVAGRTQYARSLLRLASLLVKGSSVRTSHAIGIFDAHTFERRLMKLIEAQTPVRGVRRSLAIAGCILFGAVTCGSALALRVNVEAPAGHSEEKPATSRSGPVRISGGVMAGNLLTQVNPTYPDAARKAKIQGAVVLHAIIGKDGTIENLQVVSGPKELQGAALDAVRQWTYKPYRLNGEITEVETTITVNFALF